MQLRLLIAAVLYLATLVIVASGSALTSAQTPPPIDIFVEEGIGVDEGTDADPPVATGSDENVTVTEDVLVIPGDVLGPLDIDVDDGVTVDDGAGVVGPATIDVDDGVTVNDDPGVVGPATIDVDDGVSVSDDPAVIGPVTFTVTDIVLVEDSGGPVSSTPIVEAGPPVTADEGQAINLQASVITLNPELTTASVDWGDGDADTITPSSSGAISLLHLYSGDGVFAVTVTVTGPFGDSGSDTVQVTILNLPPTVDAGGPYDGNISDAIVLTAVGTDPGGDPLSYAWDFDGDGQFDDAAGKAVIFSSTTPDDFPVAVQVADNKGESSTGSATVEVKDPTSQDEAEPGSNEAEPEEERESIGKSFGRAVIGTLVELTAAEIVVGTDLGDVRAHIDSAATEISASLDAEAYTTGSKVVVVADGPVESNDATAIKITHIPSKAERVHRRVVVAEPDAGNTIKLVGDDGSVVETAESADVETGSGDQVVLIVKKDRQGNDADVKIVARADDVDDRLNQIAQEKFDGGNADDSASVDQLRKDNRQKDELLVEKVSDHDDAEIRNAGKDAAGKIDEAKQNEAADPLVAIRKQAAADSEDAILTCASDVVGRPVAGEADLTAEELDKVTATCLEEDDRDGGGGIPQDVGEREEPPAEVLDCIIQVLGGVPDGPVSDADKKRLDAECLVGGDDGDDGEDSGGKSDVVDGSGFTQSDARKIEFCESNPSDPHCEGFDSHFNPDEIDFGSSTPWAGSKGDGEKGDGIDFTEGEPAGDAELKKLCEANPDDAKCGGVAGSSGDGDDASGGTDAEKKTFCNANPSDPKCASDDDSDSDGDSSDTKDDDGDRADTKDDDGGDQTPTKSDPDPSPPPSDSGGKGGGK